MKVGCQIEGSLTAIAIACGVYLFVVSSIGEPGKNPVCSLFSTIEEFPSKTRYVDIVNQTYLENIKVIKYNSQKMASKDEEGMSSYVWYDEPQLISEEF